MITLMTGVAILALDTGFVLFSALVAGSIRLLLLLPVWHILVAAAAMRALIRFFPVPDGEFHKGSREFDYWRARAFLSVLSCNTFDLFVPVCFRSQWYRLFGASIAPGARVTGRLFDCDLVTVERNAVLNVESVVFPHSRDGNVVRIGRVAVKQNATVDIRAILMPGVTVEENGAVAACSLVPAGQTVRRGETWAGMPARAIKGWSPLFETLTDSDLFPAPWDLQAVTAEFN